MPESPGEREEKMNEVLDAWKNMRPAKSFGGMTLEEFEAFVEESMKPRRRLKQIADEEIEQQTLRDTTDIVTMQKVQLVVNGVKADEEEGEDGALYEAMGYVRKSERQSGLTRRKKEDDNGGTL